jgi:hypothetical protein
MATATIANSAISARSSSFRNRGGAQSRHEQWLYPSGLDAHSAGHTVAAMADPEPRMTAKVQPPGDVVAALKNSGFPFQTAVAHAIESFPHWRIHKSEYAWLKATGETQFLDLIATNGNLYLTIECKKTRKESLTFLRPTGTWEPTHVVPDFRCLDLQRIRDSSQRFEVSCGDWYLNPVRMRRAFAS